MSDTSRDQNQGEGNREAAEEYNQEQHEFVESGKVDEAPDPSAQSEEEGRRAEEEGKSRAKEFDPELERDYSKATRS
jgi:hypothetical protein